MARGVEQEGRDRDKEVQIGKARMSVVFSIRHDPLGILIMGEKSHCHGEGWVDLNQQTVGQQLWQQGVWMRVQAARSARIESCSDTSG